MKNQYIVLIVIVVLVVAGAFYYFSKTNTACPEDLKICPDGSSVGREGFNCEFRDCPDLVVCEDSGDCGNGMGCYIYGTKKYCAISAETLCVEKCGAVNRCDISEEEFVEVYCLDY
ncbi:MAG: hypothetical protein KKD18_02500 [Nanoarchaeota archaeon]|nr:hypothetical protein [Nanoarchaeota archaeon]MBU0977261.1 hypothetical protein [Nanoarchaeota archaeon]